MAVEGHARRRLARQEEAKPRTGRDAEPWDRNSIARMAAEAKVRQAQKEFRPPPPSMTLDQRKEIERLAKAIDLPVQVEHLSHMTGDEATVFIADLGRAQGDPIIPTVQAEDFLSPEDFLTQLESKAAKKATAATAIPLTLNSQKPEQVQGKRQNRGK
jgi:hypothetical protein